MKIFHAIGLGVLILTLKFLVPEIFRELEETLLLLFDTAQNGLNAVNDGVYAATVSESLSE